VYVLALDHIYQGVKGFYQLLYSITL